MVQYDFTVTQPDDFGSPMFKRREEQDLYSRTVSLKLISNPAVDSSLEGKQVWVVSHGWNSDYNAFGRDLAKKIVDARPQDVVFAVDWEDAARTTLIESDSNLNDAVGVLFAGASFYAGTWIGVVADAIAGQLAGLGIKNENINLVGHSLGTLLNNEIAYRLISNYNAQTGGSKVKSITSLDPASDNILARPASFRFANGYVYARRVGDTFQDVNANSLQYKELAEFSRSFLARSSVAGNASFASEADEAILVDYNTTLNQGQHIFVHSTFQEIISNSKGLTGGLLDLNDYRVHSEFQQDHFAASGTFNLFEGVVLADPSLSPSNAYPVRGFYAKKVGENGFVIYGRDADDRVEIVPTSTGSRLVMNGGTLDQTLVFADNMYYLGAGNDYLVSYNGNDIIYGDFPEEWLQKGWSPPSGSSYNDTVFAGEGNDTVYGGRGNDKLHGQGGADILWGNEGNDELRGDLGDDALRGDEGDDRLFGDEGLDFLSGGQGDDLLYGGDGGDLLRGEEENDLLFGDSGGDALEGGEGKDDLFGGEGDDWLYGGNGDDVLVGVEVSSDTPGLGEWDVLRGGAGADKFVLGEWDHVFYLDSSNSNSQAFIHDFDPAEGDKIQLKGAPDDYTLIVDDDGTYISRKIDLDLVLLQDISASFKDKLTSIKQLIPAAVDSLDQANPTMRFGVTTFSDRKETLRFRYPRYEDVIVGYSEGGVDMYGNPYGPSPIYESQQTGVNEWTDTWTYSMYGQWAYLSTNLEYGKSSVGWLYPGSSRDYWEDGYGEKTIEDGKEAQLDALFSLAKTSSSYGLLREDVARIVVIATNSLFHQAGDMAAEVSYARPNDGNQWIMSDEDYVSVEQLQDALITANIVPIFAVTETVKGAYTDLVAELGVGTVVDLSATPQKIANTISKVVGQSSRRDDIAFVKGNVNLNLSDSSQFEYV